MFTRSPLFGCLQVLAVAILLSGCAEEPTAPEHAVRPSFATDAYCALYPWICSPSTEDPAPSAIGYYGDSGAEPRTEESKPGEGFLALVAQEWESEAVRAEGAGTRVVLLRTGLVLERAGGALPRMIRPFKFFVGGPIGSGRQYVSWIHRLDVIEMIRWIIETPAVSGPVNATAPHPVTNRDFSRALGHALRRPSLLPAPAFALKAMFGELAGPLLLEGQRVLPTRAQAHGYHFRYPEIDIAMRGIFGE